MPTTPTRPATATALTKHGAPVRVSGHPSPLQRMAASAMHLHACEERGDAGAHVHTIAVCELAETIGFEPHDWPTLHEALLGLADIRISFDLTTDGGERVQGRMGYMSKVSIEHNAGLCRYSYHPAMRAWLRRPELRAHLNRAVQLRAFTSRYALALYETCVRHKDDNSGDLALQFRRAGDQQAPAVTGWKPLNWWRNVLAVREGHYPQFKYLKRDVLKPAMREVNALSDIGLEMQHGRKHRQVEELLFVIRCKRQPALLAPEDVLPRAQTRDPEPPPPIALPDARPPVPPMRKAAAPAATETPRPPMTHEPEHAAREVELRARMRACGIPGHRHDAFLALEKKDPGRIARNLQHMNAILKAKPDYIKKPAAWAQSAILKDYAATPKPKSRR